MEEFTNTKKKDKKSGPDGRITLWIAIIGCLLGVFNGVFDKFIYFDKKKTNSLEVQSSEKYEQEVREYSGDILSIIEKIYRNISLASQDATFVLDITKEIEQLSKIHDTKHFETIVKFAEEKHQVEFANGISLLIIKYKTYSLDELFDLVHSLKEIIENPTFQEKARNFKLGKNQLVLDNERIKKDSTSMKNEASLIFQDTILYYSSLDSFKPFVDYLVITKHINDPDVLFFYGVMEKDLDFVENAIELGANLDITDIELVIKYSSEYEEYYIKHFNDKENTVIELNEFEEEKEKREFNWNNFIKITNMIQLIVVLLLVIIVVMYINNIKKKIDCHNDSSAKNLDIILRKLEEEDNYQHKIQEDLYGLKTTLVKHIENSFDEIWKMENMIKTETDELSKDESVKEKENFENEDLSVIAVKDLFSDLSENKDKQYFIGIIFEKENSFDKIWKSSAETDKLSNESDKRNERFIKGIIKTYEDKKLFSNSSRIVIYLSKERFQKNKTESEEHSNLIHLIEELKKKTELIRFETNKSKRNDNFTKEKILENYYDIKILFNEWLQNYLEDKETNGIKNHFDDKEVLSFLNEYYKSGKDSNLHEDTFKLKNAVILQNLSNFLKKETDYCFYDSQKGFNDLLERIKEYIKSYNHLEDIWKTYEMVKTMQNRFLKKYNDFENKDKLNTQFKELFQILSGNGKGTIENGISLYINEFYKRLEETHLINEDDRIDMEKTNITELITRNDSSQREYFIKCGYQFLLQNLLEKEIDYCLDDLRKELQEIIEKIKDIINDDNYLEDIRMMYEKTKAVIDQFTEKSNSLEESKNNNNFKEVK
jgi:hypothetical protein